MSETPDIDAIAAEMLACPFCGNGAVRGSYSDGRWYGYCGECGARGPSFWQGGPGATREVINRAEAEALAGWNRRAAPLPPPAPPDQSDLISRAAPHTLAITAVDAIRSMTTVYADAGQQRELEIAAVERAIAGIGSPPDGERERLAGKLMTLAEFGDVNDFARKLCHEAAAALRAPAAEGMPMYRHVGRGTEYVLIGTGRMQTANWVDRKPAIDGMMKEPPVVLPPPSVDMAEVVIYRSIDDGSIWARPTEEFINDGRFEPLPAAPKGSA